MNRWSGSNGSPSGPLVNFASEPPKAGTESDVHSACTAVAALPDSFLADLRRGNAEDPPTNRYKVLPETDLTDADVPAAPPVNGRSEARLQELNAAISAALSVMPTFELPEEPTALATPVAMPSPVVAAASITSSPITRFEIPAPEPSLAGEPISAESDERWVLIALAIAVIIAFASAGSSIFDGF